MLGSARRDLKTVLEARYIYKESERWGSTTYYKEDWPVSGCGRILVRPIGRRSRWAKKQVGPGHGQPSEKTTLAVEWALPLSVRTGC